MNKPGAEDESSPILAYILMIYMVSNIGAYWLAAGSSFRASPNWLYFFSFGAPQIAGFLVFWCKQDREGRPNYGAQEAIAAGAIFMIAGFANLCILILCAEPVVASSKI